MRIGELSSATGVSQRSLRYYEEQGLLVARRCPNGWRIYREDAVDRVITIQHLFAAGLCSTTIGHLLPCLDAPPEERTGELERLLDQHVERLMARRRDIDRELATVRALQAEEGLPGPS